MRKLNLFLLITGMIFAVGCDSKEDPTFPDLQTVLAGNYWNEKTYPIVMQNGKAVVSEEKTLYDLQEPVGTRNGKQYPTFNEDLGVFYVRADHVIRKYTAFTETNKLVYVLSNCYKCQYNPDWKSIHLTSSRDALKNGWFADADLRIVSVTDGKIVLEAPVKDYTREELKLGEDVIGLQTVWRRIDNPKNAKQWGGDLTNCKTLTDY